MRSRVHDGNGEETEDWRIVEREEVGVESSSYSINKEQWAGVGEKREDAKRIYCIGVFIFRWCFSFEKRKDPVALLRGVIDTSFISGTEVEFAEQLIEWLKYRGLFFKFLS